MIASGLLFSAMGAMVKYLSTHLPNEMVVFFRSAMGLAALLPWVWRRGFGQLKTRQWRGHLLRGLAGLAAMYCYFFAIAHMPLAEATLLNYSTPLFVPFIAMLWLGEKISHRLWAAIGLGFFGIVLILKPGPKLFTPVSLIGVASGIFAALAMTSIRRLTRSEPTLRIVFYFSAVGTAVSAVPLVWRWQAPPSRACGCCSSAWGLSGVWRNRCSRAPIPVRRPHTSARSVIPPWCSPPASAGCSGTRCRTYYPSPVRCWCAWRVS